MEKTCCSLQEKCSLEKGLLSRNHSKNNSKTKEKWLYKQQCQFLVIGRSESKPQFNREFLAVHSVSMQIDET